MVHLWCRHLLHCLGVVAKKKSLASGFGCLVVSLGSVPKLMCATPGVSSVKVRLTIAVH